MVETNSCTLLRHPDLVRFRRDWLRKTGSKPVSRDQIAQKVYCDLKVVRKPGLQITKH